MLVARLAKQEVEALLGIEPRETHKDLRDALIFHIGRALRQLQVEAARVAREHEDGDVLTRIRIAEAIEAL